MNCRQFIRCSLTVVVAVIALQPPTFAQTTSSECQATPYQVTYFQKQIPALTALDIIGAPAGTDGVAHQVTTKEELLATQPPFKLNATRDLKSFWRMRVKTTDIPFLKAKFTVTKGNPSNPKGSPFNKVNAQQSGNIVQVAACADDTVLVEGGVSLVFSNLSELPVGLHMGWVEMCVVTEKEGCP